MPKYATFDIQICFKYDAIVPDSHASSYKHKGSNLLSRSNQFLTFFRPSQH